MNQHINKITLEEMDSDLMIYFNWSANALLPIRPGSADKFLNDHRTVILKIAQHLLERIQYVPTRIYRGIILREAVNIIAPKRNLAYLSFSTDRQMAEHFANTNGFGSDVLDVAAQLGTHGYVIEYTPKISEVLFHHDLLFYLPYGEAFDLLGMEGEKEVKSLFRQKEVIILQPQQPFTTITKQGT